MLAADDTVSAQPWVRLIEWPSTSVRETVPQPSSVEVKLVAQKAALPSSQPHVNLIWPKTMHFQANGLGPSERHIAYLVMSYRSREKTTTHK